MKDNPPLQRAALIELYDAAVAYTSDPGAASQRNRGLNDEAIR